MTDTSTPTTRADALNKILDRDVLATTDGAAAVIDVGVGAVAIAPGADRASFLAWLRDATTHPGDYATIDADRLAQGPSYIEIGAWVGSQHIAFMVMALGQHHGLWTVVTPQPLGITDPDVVGTMLGGGFVMIAGFDPAALAETPQETP